MFGRVFVLLACLCVFVFFFFFGCEGKVGCIGQAMPDSLGN